MNGHECRISCSVGIALYPSDASKPDDLVKNADAAMYEAKEAGKNGYRFFRNLPSSTLGRLNLEADIRRALEKGQLFLVYQPKVDAAGFVVGVEALLR